MGGGEALVVDTLGRVIYPSYRDRVTLHEAGHFLVAYLVGLLPRAYTLSAWDAFSKWVEAAEACRGATGGRGSAGWLVFCCAAVHVVLDRLAAGCGYLLCSHAVGARTEGVSCMQHAACRAASSTRCTTQKPLLMLPWCCHVICLLAQVPCPECAGGHAVLRRRL